MQVEYAELSLLGDREENQDRVAIIQGDESVLLIVIDGMGGHADGALAAEVSVATLTKEFGKVKQPVFDPQGFLHQAIATAHQALVDLGDDQSVESRPRATCTLCLVQDNSAYWAHVGDSRIYHLRDQQILERTRDHSHVELLLQEGLIAEDEIMDHPMRNFVECCLGGDFTLPGMTVTRQKPLLPMDILLCCSDGFWSGLTDDDFSTPGQNGESLSKGLQRLGEQAVRQNNPHSDNTSAVALQFLGRG